MSEEAQKGEDFNHKKLQQVLGFLVYVSNMFPAMTTYLKVIHLILDQWRGGIDDDIWQLLES